MKSIPARTCAIASIVVALLSFPAAAEIAVIQPDVSRTLAGAAESLGDSFGDHVAAWNDWLFVGAPQERDLACRFADGGTCDNQADGALYVYRCIDGNYRLVQSLRPREVNPRTLGDRFGSGVAAAGGQLLVAVANYPAEAAGGPVADFAGAVEVYEIDSSTGLWVWTGQTLTSPNPGLLGAFASRTDSAHMELDHAGRFAVIGESFNNPGPAPRALHVFRRTGGNPWQLVDTILAPEDARGEPRSFADKVVTLSNGYYVVSSQIHQTQPDGSLLRFLQVHLYGPAPAPGRISSLPVQTIEQVAGPAELPFVPSTFGFGHGGMSYAAGRLIVLDPAAEVDGFAQAGVAYVYRFRPNANPRLQLESVIPHPQPATNSRWGNNNGPGRQQIAFDGTRLAIGTAAVTISTAAGSSDVFVFERTGTRFDLTARLVSDIPFFGVRLFGQSVSFLNGQVAAGQLSTAVGNFGGRVLFYDLYTGTTP